MTEDWRVTSLVLVSYLTVFAVFYVLLPVEEPVWDFVLAGVLHDGHHTLHLEKE